MCFRTVLCVPRLLGATDAAIFMSCSDNVLSFLSKFVLDLNYNALFIGG